MQKSVRTDLAVEAKTLCASDAALSGVRAEERTVEGFPVTTIRITEKSASETLCKPVGTYHTIFLDPVLRREEDAFDRAAHAVASLLRDVLSVSAAATVLVVGLGNREITPDAVGPSSAERILATRHLREQLPEQFSAMRSVTAFSPGVLGQTGLESAEVVKAICERIRADVVIVVDALACSEPERLCHTVQVTDVGIVPGSGVGNDRAAFNSNSLGVPVVAIGVPTVMDGGAFCDSVDAQGLFITPRDIDAVVADFSKVIAYGVNLALQPELTISDLDLLLS